MNWILKPFFCRPRALTPQGRWRRHPYVPNNAARYCNGLIRNAKNSLFEDWVPRVGFGLGMGGSHFMRGCMDELLKKRHYPRWDYITSSWFHMVMIVTTNGLPIIVFSSPSILMISFKQIQVSKRAGTGFSQVFSPMKQADNTSCFSEHFFKASLSFKMQDKTKIYFKKYILICK